MKINFVEDGKNFTAILSYNLEERDDCVLVSFEGKSHEDIVFSKTNEEWHSLSGLQTTNPLTYLNIQKSIFKHFTVR